MSEREAARRGWERIEAVYVSAFVPEARMKRLAEVRSMLFDIELAGHDAGVAKIQTELDAALAVIENVRALLPGPRTWAESLSRMHDGSMFPQMIDAEKVAAALGLTAGQEGERDE